jgi:hypothetical protein
MSFVFVVDQDRKPLDPVHPGRARFLLSQGHAAVLRRYPFTLILKEVKPDVESQPVRVKLDPGSKTTGVAVVNDSTGHVVWAAEITHRGEQVNANLDARRSQRHGRRHRHTRYRPARFANRTRPKGWLPPSLESRLANTLTWVARLMKWCPIGAISVEWVKFDTQVMQHAEISGVEYQQGELQGYEVREYLLEKWHRACAYCGVKNVPLQAALYERLQATGLPVETGTGGRTKWNRTQRHLPKTHWLDAACVGASTPAALQVQHVMPLCITAMGRHSRQMCRTDAQGFPNKAAKATSVVGGFRTGDIVRAVVPASSSKAGTYVGRIAIRATGKCNIKTAQGAIQGAHVRYCQPLHRSDGYSYTKARSA